MTNMFRSPLWSASLVARPAEPPPAAEAGTVLGAGAGSGGDEAYRSADRVRPSSMMGATSRRGG